jgi:hypothetical protein
MDAISSGHRVIAGHGEQLPLQRNAAHDGQVIPCLKDTQDGRLTQRRIGSNAGGQQVEARFVHKNQCAAFQPGLFFNSAQTSDRHVAMAVSSRWLARSSGIWGVHFKSLSKRATCDLWYTTPHSHSITLPTRGHVHTSPRKPYASAPWDNKSGSRCFWSIVNSAGRPVCGLACKADQPDCAARLSHWLTAPFDTPKARAISSCFQPCCFKA